MPAPPTRPRRCALSAPQDGDFVEDFTVGHDKTVHVNDLGAGGGGFCMALMDNEKSAKNFLTVIDKHYQSFYSLIPANQA